MAVELALFSRIQPTGIFMSSTLTHITHINPIDRDALRETIRTSQPVRNFCIDNFLEESFANEVLAAYPSFEEAIKVGRSFSAVNEKGKVQVTDSSSFAEPIAELNQTLASPEFLEMLSDVFEMPNLLADEKLVGGGIHQTGARGHLDVHVDFNYLAERELHRRLNILIYFNKDWKPEYGGNIELWDKDVKTCVHSFSPIFNRCVIFETNEISYHGVTAVKCPEGQARKSFAAYYYTREAPAHWNGQAHTTIFKARPDEVLKGSVAMPLENVKNKLVKTLRDFKGKFKR
jgi:Rps23 Pro-64 3,4-dihydroxylase Tpa1-like proline 4-hydroxylase